MTDTIAAPLSLTSPLISLGAADAEACVDGVCAVPAIVTDTEKVVISLDEGSTAY